MATAVFAKAKRMAEVTAFIGFCLLTFNHQANCFSPIL